MGSGGVKDVANRAQSINCCFNLKTIEKTLVKLATARFNESIQYIIVLELDKASNLMENREANKKNLLKGLEDDSTLHDLLPLRV